MADAGSPNVIKKLSTAGAAAKIRRFRSTVGTLRQQTWMRVGATSGFVLTAIDNSKATMAQSQTAGTLVIPILGLKVGDTITGYSLQGMINAGVTGNSTTINSALHSVQAVAGSSTDTAITSATTSNISTVNAALNSTTAVCTGLASVVTADTTFYILVTGTTAAAVTAAIHGALVTVTEA
jgi:hypothetical protein